LDFSRFQVCSFDCYGTLVDWESGILSVLRPLVQEHGHDLDDTSILALFAELERDAEGREYQPYRKILEGVVWGLGKVLKFNPTAAEAHALPESLPNWSPFEDTSLVLRALKRQYKLAVISNVDDDLFAATQVRVGIEFDFIVTAQQAQAYKPSLKIFQFAEERMHVSRDCWLHAAQSIYHDVIPAESLGIATVWVNRPSVRPGAGAAAAASAHPDLEVTNLAALAELASGAATSGI